MREHPLQYLVSSILVFLALSLSILVLAGGALKEPRKHLARVSGHIPEVRRAIGASLEALGEVRSIERGDFNLQGLQAGSRCPRFGECCLDRICRTMVQR